MTCAKPGRQSNGAPITFAVTGNRRTILYFALKFLGLFWLIFSFEPPLLDAEGHPSAPAADTLGAFEHSALTESSGLAASPTHPGVLWTHNDSGDKPRIFASTLEGRHLAVVTISGADARDWEDLAAFTMNGKAYLLAADTGDNYSRRKICTLYVIEEPVLDLRQKDVELTQPPEWRQTFTYEGGPRNCEAVAVDARGRQILLLSKQDLPAVLFTLALEPNPATDEPMVARPLAPVDLPQPGPQDLLEDPVYGKYRSQPTALDISPNSRRALVVTYKDAYIFHRPQGVSWQQAFSGGFTRIMLPKRRQGESGCFTIDGRAIVIGTEGRPSTLWRIAL